MNAENLCRRSEYYKESPDWAKVIWHRPKSIDHFYKFNREQLVSEGAMAKVGRDYFIDKEVFPKVAAKILGLVIGGEG